jgi:hypothetical protein
MTTMSREELTKALAETEQPVAGPWPAAAVRSVLKSHLDCLFALEVCRAREGRDLTAMENVFKEWGLAFEPKHR